MKRLKREKEKAIKSKKKFNYTRNLKIDYESQSKTPYIPVSKPSVATLKSSFSYKLHRRQKSNFTIAQMLPSTTKNTHRNYEEIDRQIEREFNCQTAKHGHRKSHRYGLVGLRIWKVVK